MHLIDEAASMQQASPPFGLNVIGYASANLGLGNTLRQYVSCLIARGVQVRVLDLDAGVLRSKFDNSFQHLTDDHAEDLPYAVNLYIISALTLSSYALSPPKGLQIEGRLNVAFPWWELTDIPKYWAHAGQLFDALIAGSDFIRSTLTTHIPGVPVLLAPHPIHIPDTVVANRARFQLPEDAFLVYTGFEPDSDLARKNPFGAVEAFKRAFPNSPNCHLVIKVNNHGNPDVVGKRLDLLQRLYTSIQSNLRIHLIQESLPYEELLSLYASCDAFINLHRSEGLGLVPLEAMRLGKPVVATAWSGNMCYMNYRNACLVDFEFTDTGDSYFYSKANLGINGFWAEPDVDQAAAWLRKLAEDPEFRSRIGSRAATDTLRYDEQARKVEFVDELRAIWENREFLPQRDREVLIQQARESSRVFHLRKMGRLERLAHQAKTELDRQILWRFRSAKT